MPALAQELQIIIAATALLFILTSFVAVFIVIQQNRYNRYVRDKREMQVQYEQEILKSQLEMQEKTLHEVSQEIHDNIGQLLSLVKLNLNTIDLGNREKSVEKVQATGDLVGNAINALRNISKTLNSDFIQNGSLSDSILRELELLKKTGLYETKFELEGAEEPIEPKRKLILFRMIQEILSNIVKHSQSKSVNCLLQFSSKNFRLQFKDDGIGFEFDPSFPTKNTGTGQMNLHHRAKLIEADISILSKPGDGTSISLILPKEVS